MAKESQNRYSKIAKDWGWREFVTLTSLFDIDLGYLANDTLTLCAEVAGFLELALLSFKRPLCGVALMAAILSSYFVLGLLGCCNIFQRLGSTVHVGISLTCLRFELAWEDHQMFADVESVRGGLGEGKSPPPPPAPRGRS